VEHRLGLRRHVNQPAYLWTPGGRSVPVAIVSVSISGAFIVTSMSLPLLVRVRVRITSLPGQKKTRSTVGGYVVRQGPGGFAIEWSEFAPSVVRALIKADRTTTLERAARRRLPEVEHPQCASTNAALISEASESQHTW
jgi:hypothetical protein